jgi:hypothetical protein
MGTEPINVTSSMSKNNKSKIFTLTKKDAGQTYTMTATIFDRNKQANMERNVDAAPTDMIIDSNDGIQFKGDVAHFNANDVASVKCALFEGYDDMQYDGGSTKDKDVKKQWSGNSVSGIVLDTGDDSINLGKFKSALDELSPSGNCKGGQGAGNAQGAGASNQGGSASQQYTPGQFGGMTIPNATPICDKIRDTSYCGIMLSGGDADITPYLLGTPMDAALGAIFNGYGGLFANLCNALGGNSGGGAGGAGGSVGNTGGGSGSSGPTAPSTDDVAKKAAEIKEAKEAEKERKAELLKKATEEREKEVNGIVNDIYTAVKNTGGVGTDNEKLLAAVQNIKKDNVLEVMEAWKKSKHAGEMNEESLVKLIGDVTDGYSNSESYNNGVAFNPLLGGPLTAPLYSAIKGEKVSYKYLNPIKVALSERSGSNESSQLALQAETNYNSHFKINDSSAIDKIDELYKQVKKEQEKGLIKDPLVVQVDSRIEKENAKAKAATTAKAEETKAKAEADKNNSTVESLQKEIAAINGKKKKTKADKAKLVKEQEELDKAKVAQAEANEKAEEAAQKAKKAEAAKKAIESATLIKSEPKAKAPKKEDDGNTVKKDEAEDKTPWWHLWGKVAPEPATADTTTTTPAPAVTSPAPATPAPTPAASTPASATTATATATATSAQAPAAPAPTPAPTAPVASAADVEALKKEYVRLKASIKAIDTKTNPTQAEIATLNKLTSEQFDVLEKLKLKMSQADIGKL